MNAREYNREIFCDLSRITQLSVDAIMYLVAIIRDARHGKRYNVIISGNTPNDRACAEYLDKVGFYNFVRRVTATEIQPPSDSALTIKKGNTVDPNVQKGACEFVNQTLELSRIETRPLFAIIGELMTNAVQHAYIENETDMLEQWYLCIEDTTEYQRFIFLDTGAGIPATAKRSLVEQVEGSFFNNDSKILESAFRGKIRTRTKENSRGRGLPSIYEYCKKGLVDNMTVISGNGICQFGKTAGYDIVAGSLHYGIVGTLYVWDIVKKGA